LRGAARLVGGVEVGAREGMPGRNDGFRRGLMVINGGNNWIKILDNTG